MATYPVTFKYNSKPIYFELPSKADQLSRIILKTKNFYESKYLNYIRDHRLELFNSDLPFTVIDVGAGVGTHSVYFAKIMGAQVFAFEPNVEAYLLLQKNIELNDVIDHVVCRRIGIFSKECNMSILHSSKQSINSTRWCTNPIGTVKATALDYLFRDPISLIKIDVCGLEMKVLEGAKHLIESCSPVIMIDVSNTDSFGRNLDEFNEWLKDMKYYHVESQVFIKNTFLIAREKDTELEIEIKEN